MKLWRLVRAQHQGLDGAGALRHGARYTSPGLPVVNFASEAGLAVLIALRYLPGRNDPELAAIDQDYLLGWIEVDGVAERLPFTADADCMRSSANEWLISCRSLLAAVSSAVLPEADVVMMNPCHPHATTIPRLVTRPFSFADCLHRPPMLDIYRGEPQ